VQPRASQFSAEENELRLEGRQEPGGAVRVHGEKAGGIDENEVLRRACDVRES
jgi:hypothetical protein